MTRNHWPKKSLWTSRFMCSFKLQNRMYLIGGSRMPRNQFIIGKDLTILHFKPVYNFINPYMEILEKKSKTRGITQRHFWKKNPTNFLKSGFRGVTQRHLWKKIFGFLVWIFFPKMTLGHSPEKSYNFSLNLDIFYWWRHMYDVITYIGSVGDGASISHDVTWWLLCVTS